ncbi:MAG: DUF308 domain-containing protein [Clostridium sp.]|nr:DUF308 domain-containing protein [Clostridium sp.]
MNKYDIVKQAKIFNLIIYSFMAVVGLFLLLFTGLGIRQEIVIIGALCILVGGAKMLGYFSNDLYRLAFQFDFAAGLFLLIIGILFLIVGNRNPQAISITIGIYVFLDGLLKLQTALDARKFGVPKWFIMLLTAVLVVLVGIVALLAPYLDEIPQFVLLAVSLIVDGLVNIWITAYTVRIRAKKKNLEERFGLSEDEKDHKTE